jgi:hypothetical protein
MKMLVDRWYWTDRETAGEPGPRPVYFRSVGEPYRSALPASFAEAARQAGGIVERTYCLHGDVIRLCFAGSALLPVVTAALEHYNAPASRAPDLTIRLWDSTSTSSPPPAWPEADARAAPVVGSAVFPPLDAAAIDVLSALDDRQTGYWWVRDAANVPSYERASPCAQLLAWWWRARGRHLLHAAALGNSAGAVLLPGHSGAGKSTTALACLNAGLGYLGDDKVLAVAQPSPMLMNVYSSAKIHSDNLERVPFAAPWIRNSNRLTVEKALMFLHDSHAAQLIDQAPLRAILLPRITGSIETRLLPAAPTAALTTMIPSLFLRFVGERDEVFATLASLVRQTPCYWLELGTDLAQVARVIADTLEIEPALTTAEDIP